MKDYKRRAALLCRVLSFSLHRHYDVVISPWPCVVEGARWCPLALLLTPTKDRVLEMNVLYQLTGYGSRIGKLIPECWGHCNASGNRLRI